MANKQEDSCDQSILTSALDSRATCWISSQVIGPKCLVVDCRNKKLATLLGTEDFFLVGVDANKVIVDNFANQLKSVSEQEPSFFLGGLEQFDRISSKFDSVIVGESAERIGDVKEVCKLAASKLRVGGRFLLSAPLTKDAGPKAINTIAKVLDALPEQVSVSVVSVKDGCLCISAELLPEGEKGTAVNGEALLAALEEGICDYREKLTEQFEEVSDWSVQAASSVKSAPGRAIVTNNTVPEGLKKSFDQVRLATLDVHGKIKQREQSIAQLKAEIAHRHSVEKTLHHNLAILYGETLLRSPIVAPIKRTLKKIAGKHPYSQYQAEAELSRILEKRGAEPAKAWIDKALRKKLADEVFLCSTAFETFKGSRFDWAREYGQRAVEKNPNLIHIKQELARRP